MVKPSRLIAIPAFNEADTLEAVINGLQALNGFSIIVVDDGSTDNTSDVLKNIDCITLTHKTNLGYEAAINSAFAYANEYQYEEIIFVDADGEHALANISDFSFTGDDTFLIKVGSRQKRNRIAEYLAGIWAGLLFGVKDPYCGLKSYNLRRLNDYKLKHSPGAQIGTGLMKEIVRKVGKEYVCNIPIRSKKRVGTSRFSRSNIYANTILMMTIFK